MSSRAPRPAPCRNPLLSQVLFDDVYSKRNAEGYLCRNPLLSQVLFD